MIIRVVGLLILFSLFLAAELWLLLRLPLLFLVMYVKQTRLLIIWTILCTMPSLMAYQANEFIMTFRSKMTSLKTTITAHRVRAIRRAMTT